MCDYFCLSLEEYQQDAGYVWELICIFTKKQVTCDLIIST